MINHIKKKPNDIFGLERCKISTMDTVCNLIIHSAFDSEVILVSQQVSACHLSSRTFKYVQHDNKWFLN